MRANEILKPEEIQSLIRPSDMKGLQAVLTTWLMIFGSFALVAYHPAFWSVAAALIILGGRHLALAILMHEGAHYSLFKTRRLNDWVGSWLCAYPTWQHLARYREHHIRHHRYAGSDKDPDLDLVTAYPCSKISLRRKLLRDLSGISGLRRIYGLLGMDLGFIQYTVSSNVVRLDSKSRQERLRLGLRNMHGVVLTNLALFSLLALVGHPALYVMWIVSYLTTFSVFVRIRAIAEHACTAMDLDPFKSTRTTHANWLARITVAPHRVNHHLEHHLLMTAPYFSLPKIHRALKERGALQSAHSAPGYWQVLKTATTVRT